VSNPDFFQTSNFELQTSSHLYKTGDLARWLPDGNIEFLGRMDHQVKIRGYRIELGEIESRLLQHEAVKEAVAVSKTGPDGNQFLCAYVVSHGNEGFTVGELREFLARELPDYMIPSYFIPMEQIPLTANGKVDRKALAGSSKTLKPEAKLQTGVEYVAPRNEIEAKLAAVWQEVLGIERIGITEDFFEIGGDSIKAMLIVSSLRKQELKLEIKHFFQQKNIEKLAPDVESYHEEGSWEIVTGVIDLITTQKGFFRKTRTDINHWNISVMLFKKDRFEETAITKVFQKLVEHHDALRITFTMEGEQVTQYNRGLEGKLFELKVFDCREDGADTTRMDEEVYALHRSMDLTRGPLVKLGLFQREDGDHLLMIIHHLICDWISLRLIVEDFAAGYRQAVRNEAIQLPEKTSSLKEWSEQLSVYANSQELLQELDYWKALEKTSVPPLPKDRLSSENRRKDDETLSAVLLTDQETKMLFKANPAFAANVKVSLLAAFGAAIREWTGADQVMVDYKIHGREDIFKEIDVTRTVGWFATEFPLILDISPAHDLSALMESIEGIFRNLPGRGLGYETLREMTLPQNKAPLTFNLNPEILFNYSGEVNHSIHAIFNDFGFSPLFKNLNESPDSERKYTLIVELGIVMGQVNINLHYNRHEYDEKTMNGFIESYRKKLFRLFAGSPASIANSAMEMNQEQADGFR
jgi:non-ribosomal peptide synthase protein (TIGR01720 family)